MKKPGYSRKMLFRPPRTGSTIEMTHHQHPTVSDFFIIVVFASVALFLVSCNSNTATKPVVADGFIDASQWDFGKNGMVGLHGDWKFQWNKDDPDVIKKDYNDAGWDLFSVPGSWNTRTKTSFGFCWLRLKLKLPPCSDLSLYCPLSMTSAAFYVNGKKIEETGKAGNSRETSTPRFAPTIIPLPSDTAPCTIAWKISNYNDVFGGPMYSLQLGTLQQLLQRIWADNILFIIILGIYFMMICHHFILLIDRKRDKAYFYLFILCIVSSLYFFNFEMEKMIPLNIPFIHDIQIKLEFLLCLVILLIVMLYLKSLHFIDRRNRGFFCAIAYILIETLFALISPTWLFSSMLPVGHFISLIWCLFIWYILFSAYRLKKKDALWFLCMVTLLIFLVAHDILTFYFKSIPIKQHVSNYACFIFLFLQSLITVKRFSIAFKKAEYLSLHLTEEVERQTVQLSTQKKELEHKNNKLNELDRYKTEFFQNITHEFRTPLTLIVGPVESALKEGGVSLSSSIKEYLQVIKRNAGQLLGLINQILDLSKLDAGRMQLSLEKIDIVSLCKSVHHSFITLAESKNIAYTIESPENALYICSDKDKIARVLSNLLSNAFKFTAQDGKIAVKIDFPYVLERSAGKNVEMVRIAIEDTGIGISEKDLPHIFERFHQADGSTSRRFGGTGIGLALVKEEMDILEGEVMVRSSQGIGSVFSILLPTKISISLDERKVSGVREDQLPTVPVSVSPKFQEPADIIDYTADPNPTGKNVLYTDSVYDSGKKIVFVLEDSEELLLYLKKNLESKYNFFAAMNGLQGLGKIKKLPHLPDLIISDIMMPVMDGLDFYKRLTTNEEFLHIPIIFLTAKTDERLKALSLGAVDFICKPFDVHVLIHKIESLLKLQIYQDKITTNNLQEKISAIFQQNSGTIAPDSQFEEKCRHYKITEREKQIIRLIQRGYGDKEIANELYLSKYTVNNHLKNIYRKCSANSRIELINKFFHN